MSTSNEAASPVTTDVSVASNSRTDTSENEAIVAPQTVEQPFKVYKPPTIPLPLEDLPEDYFTPTIADLKARQEQLHARATNLNNAPLRTRVQREQQVKTKLDRWPNTTIRVRFLDRTQLEKTFPSSSKIRSVYAFVLESLREDVKPIKFILSSNPPPRDLKVSDPAVRDLTLAELGLAPSSVLLLRFVDDSLNRSDLPAPLASAVLEHAVDLPAPPSFDRNQKKEDTSPAVSASSSSSKAKDPSDGDVKIPKWLKLSSKK
ncbi:hypothetical protein B0F90DRAFT_1740778 [Multifurca ochricompacta]|uniref:UBX domain-containing protein n=1 Tax=Multifurca ochricompacta TaxID=376703 RepID=A0AAD4QJ52_9AGAM|nr:hypothetical protein B0F90DRAFT_1740778 [Multifurca ochricompacta]